MLNKKMTSSGDLRKEFGILNVVFNPLFTIPSIISIKRPANESANLVASKMPTVGTKGLVEKGISAVPSNCAEEFA